MKHLIYLIDGTWCFAGKLRVGNTFTNVHKINRDLKYEDRSGNPQLVFYSRGVGAGRFSEKVRGGGFAYGIWGDIEDVYTNICANYIPGDKIYLIGFSRGAAVARVISGLIGLGILKPEEIDHMPNTISAFKYASRRELGLRTTLAEDETHKINLDVIEKNKAHSNVKVEFLGLFDTVIGGYRISRFAQELNIIESRPATCVKNCFQIHALDDRRRTFRPSMYVDVNQVNQPQYVEQVWIPGVHSDIGGGYETTAISDFALALMVDRITAKTGLCFNLNNYRGMVKISDRNVVISNEYGWMRPFLTWLGKDRIITDSLSKLHPVVELLALKNINFQGKSRAPYKLKKSHQHKASEQYAKAFISEEFNSFSME